MRLFLEVLVDVSAAFFHARHNRPEVAVDARARAAYPETDCIMPLTRTRVWSTTSRLQSRRSASGERLPALLGGHDHLGEKASRDNGENGTVVVKAAENAVEVCVVDLRWAEGKG